MRKFLGALISVSCAAATMVGTGQPMKGKILVIMSGESQLPLKGGGTYSAGYYLNELGIPARRLIDSGYELRFASPNGSTPVLDKVSDDPRYFGGDKIKYGEIKKLVERLDELRHPRTFQAVLASGLSSYAGVFIPGGHAPMIDLMGSRELGHILRAFHESAKPTALICHGPIALAAGVDDPQGFQRALESGDLSLSARLGAKSVYRGYTGTVFSTTEEFMAAATLHGQPLFYAETALQLAGLKLRISGAWQSQVVRDRELITGQNPFSDEELAEVFIQALEERAHQPIFRR